MASLNYEHYFQGLKDVFDEAIKIVLNKDKTQDRKSGCKILWFSEWIRFEKKTVCVEMFFSICRYLDNLNELESETTTVEKRWFSASMDNFSGNLKIDG